MTGLAADEVGVRLARVAAVLDRALVDGDAAGAAACFTADAVLGESGAADAVGRAAIHEFLCRGNEVRAVTEHLLIRDELLVLQDRAIEFARFEETKVPHGGTPVRERGRVVIDWRLEPDAAWRIARLVVSDLPGD